MKTILETENFQLDTDLESGAWDLLSKGASDPSILGARMQISYRAHHSHFNVLEQWEGVEFRGISSSSSPHGTLQQAVFHFPADANGVSACLIFAAPDESPLLLWKMVLTNDCVVPVHPMRFEMLSVGMPGTTGEKSRKQSALTNLDRAPAFFSNGWGSWDTSGAYGMGDRYRRTYLGPLTVPMRVNAGTPQPHRKGHFASDMFAVLGDRETKRALVIGFLSQIEQFGSIECQFREPAPALSMWANGDGVRLDPGRSMETDWACLGFVNVNDADPLSVYLDAVAREHGMLSLDERRQNKAQSEWVPTGWCSWYHFYQDISEAAILRNLEVIAALGEELPLDVIQIDDGFQTRVGDWFDFKPGFPGGVSRLAGAISSAGYTPGLWLAPFIVGPRSRLRREHPDWLIRGKLNLPANAGFSTWGGFTAGLDLTHPDALAYAQEVVQTAVHQWGFPYLKLDFLYAAAIPGRRRDPTKTRARVLRTGLHALRDAVGDQVTLLGCGCPLGPAIGLIDAMRIGADVDGNWLPNIFGFGPILKKEPGLPSAQGAIHNTLTRGFMHRRWWVNDPDCLLLRPETALTTAEVQSLATSIALSGGSLLLSDNLPGLPPERLDIAKCMLPLIGKRPMVLDWFESGTPRRVRLDLENGDDDWHLLAWFNWHDEPVNAELHLADFGLDPQRPYLGREYWRGSVHRIEGGALALKGIPAHGVALLALRAEQPDTVQYLGSSLHISQGDEVVRLEGGVAGARLLVSRPGDAQGEVALKLTGEPQEAFVNEKECSWRQLDEIDCYAFTLDFDRLGELVIRYQNHQ